MKDLFDVAGQPTTAGSIVLAGVAPARADCPAVARLRAAGAALVGHTNMTEFAFSGVGINPHHGTPANPVTARLDATPRIPGGSTSGGAVSVAGGAAWAALGSDTGGSIRIPAALQGLVGFKSTARLVPTEGAIPLSTTLDTACAITLLGARRRAAARSAGRAHGDARGPPGARAAPRGADDDCCSTALDATVASSFERALATPARRRRARSTRSRCPSSPRSASCRSRGGFAAAEAWAWHRRAARRPRGRLRPARRGAHPPRRGDQRGRLHRPLQRARSLDRAMAQRAARLRRAALADRADRRAADSRRWSRATTPSSPPTRCCCATRRSSTCSTAARSRCPATRQARCRSA